MSRTTALVESDWARSIAPRLFDGKTVLVGTKSVREQLQVVQESLEANTHLRNVRSLELPILPWSSRPNLSESVATALLASEHLIVVDDIGKDALLAWLNSLQWKRFPKLWIQGEAHQREAQHMAESLELGNPSASLATGYALAKAHIYELLRHLSSRHSVGCVLEMGVFRGGTLMMMRRMLRELGMNDVDLLGFDTFSGFPPPRNLLDQFSDTTFVNVDFLGTQASLRSFDVQLVRGDICETIYEFKRSDILLTFFDTDNYSPVVHALPICWQNTVEGGAVVFDHFYTRTEMMDTIGERIAAVEFFEGRTDVLHLSGTGVFVKMPGA